MRSFWDNNHRLSPLYEKICSLFPVMGEVDQPRKNPKLERFRKMANAYYDLFNNGGGNRGREIGAYFGPGVLPCARARNWDEAKRIMDPIVEEALLDAAYEQSRLHGFRQVGE